MKTKWIKVFEAKEFIDNNKLVLDYKCHYDTHFCILYRWLYVSDNVEYFGKGKLVTEYFETTQNKLDATEKAIRYWIGKEKNQYLVMAKEKYETLTKDKK